MANIEHSPNLSPEEYVARSRVKFEDYSALLKDRNIADQGDLTTFISERFGPDQLDALMPFYQQLIQAVQSHAGERIAEVDIYANSNKPERERVDYIKMTTMNAEGAVDIDRNPPYTKLFVREFLEG